MKITPRLVGAHVKKVWGSNKFLLLILVAVFAIGFTALGASSSAKADIEAAAAEPAMVLAQGADTGTATGDPCKPGLGTSKESIECRAEREAASPAEYAAWAKSSSSLLDSTNYLTFSRWWNVTSLPAEEDGLTSLSQMLPVISSSLGSFVFSLASTIFLILGMLLSAAMSIDLLSKVIYTVDWVFGTVGSSILGLDSPSSTLMIIAGLVFGSALIAFVLPKSRYSGGNPLGQIMFSLLVITGIGVMTVQATKNHQGGDAPEIGATPDGYSLYDGGDNQDSGSWEPLSPGWLISKSAVLANSISGAVVSVTQSVSNAVESGNTEGYNNDCNRYIIGMHYVYSNSQAAKDSGGKSNVVVAYDNMVRKLYFQNFQSASMGDSAGVDSAWCRMAESASGQPVGDQILIARVAGLYAEAVGQGGLGMVDNNPSMVANPNAMNISGRSGGIPVSANSAVDLNRALVDTSGNWQPLGDDGSPEKTRQSATRFFGPNFNVEDNDDKVSPPRGGRMAAMYFAACQWPVPGGSVAMNPEYEGKVYEGSGNEFTNATEGDDPEQKLQNPGRCLEGGDEGPLWQTGFADGSAGSNMWNYYDFKEGEIRIPLLSDATGMSMKWGKESASTQFMASPPALQYYQHVFGSPSGSAFVLSLIALVLAIMVIKYFGPMVLGAIMSQALATLALIIAPMSVMFLVFPTARSRKMFGVLVRTILSSLLVAGMITALMSLIFAVVSIFVVVLENQTTSAFVNSLMVGLATLMGFAASMKMIEMITGVDPKSTEAAFQAGASAASPALNELGYRTPSPLTGDFWRKGRGAGKPIDDLKTDKGNAIGKSAQSAAGDSKNLVKGDSKTKGKDVTKVDDPVKGSIDGDGKKPDKEDTERRGRMAAVADALGFRATDRFRDKPSDKEDKGQKIADSGFTPDPGDTEAMERAGVKTDSGTIDPASSSARHMGIGAADQYVGDNSKDLREELQENFTADAQEDLNKAAWAGGAAPDTSITADSAIDQGLDQGLEQFQTPYTSYPGTTAPTERTAMASQAMSEADTAKMAATVISGADLVKSQGMDLSNMDLSKLSEAVSGKVNEAANDYVRAYTEQMSEGISSSSLSSNMAQPSAKIKEMRDKMQTSFGSYMNKVNTRMDSAMSETMDKSMEARGRQMEETVERASRNIDSSHGSTSNRVMSEITESFRRSDKSTGETIAKAQEQRTRRVAESLEERHKAKFADTISQYNNMGKDK